MAHVPLPIRGSKTMHKNTDLIVKENHNQAFINWLKKTEKCISSKKQKLYIKDSVEKIPSLM